MTLQEIFLKTSFVAICHIGWGYGAGSHKFLGALAPASWDVGLVAPEASSA